jgi:hypothetical protein
MLIPHQWKNKGILVPVYTLVCFVGFNISLGTLQRNFGGIFMRIGYATASICAFIIAGIWTYFTSESYYYDDDGNKKLVDIPHEFYWIKMKNWAYILWGLAAVIVVYKLVD